jgi:hypothetical protein
MGAVHSVPVVHGDITGVSPELQGFFLKANEPVGEYTDWRGRPGEANRFWSIYHCPAPFWPVTLGCDIYTPRCNSLCGTRASVRRGLRPTFGKMWYILFWLCDASSESVVWFQNTPLMTHGVRSSRVSTLGLRSSLWSQNCLSGIWYPKVVARSGLMQ